VTYVDRRGGVQVQLVAPGPPMLWVDAEKKLERPTGGEVVVKSELVIRKPRPINRVPPGRGARRYAAVLVAYDVEVRRALAAGVVPLCRGVNLTTHRVGRNTERLVAAGKMIAMRTLEPPPLQVEHLEGALLEVKTDVARPSGLD